MKTLKATSQNFDCIDCIDFVEIVSFDFIDIIKVRWLKFTVLASHIYCKPQIAINRAFGYRFRI